MRQTRRQFVRTLFVATQATVAGSLLPHRLFGEDAKAGGLNFLVLGDWGRNGEREQHDVAAQMAVAAKEMNAGFIISVGDNFYEHGVSSIDDPHWQNSFEKVYAAPSLQVPWHVALGNHDYHGNCDAQIAYSKISKRWNMPARCFTRTDHTEAGDSVEFFHLDTTPMATFDEDEIMFKKNADSQDVGKQLAWFEAALAASNAPWKLVLGHHPIYSGGGHGDTPHLIKHVLPLLEKYKVQAYFNGHDHDLQHLQADQVNLFCSGAGSKIRPTSKTSHTKFAKSCSGFTAVAMQGDRMDVRMINDRGRLLYTTTVPRTAT